MPSLAERLRREVLVCDGAMGTMLHAGGVSLDRSLPELNVSRPDLVCAIHQAYIAAGAGIIETNTFGASRFRLARHGLDGRVAELNQAGVRAARTAQQLCAPAAVLVAGSVGPATPAGRGPRLSRRELREAFREQIGALVEGGVDLLLLETFGSLAELVEAVEQALELGAPVVAQMTFVEDGRTLGGDRPDEVAQALESLGVAAIGANCTLGPRGLLEVLVGLARATRLPLGAQPNAGPPTLADGHFQYTADPTYFARFARRFVEAGASLVGGCCGTTPAHIQAAAEAVRGLAPAERSGHQAVMGTQSPRGSFLIGRRRPSGGVQRVAKRGSSGGVQGRAQRLPRPAERASHATEIGARARRGSLSLPPDFLLAAELPIPTNGDAEAAVQDAHRLWQAGCEAVVVGPVASARPQVSPASIASLVQQRIPELRTILTATTWEKSLLVLQADLLGAHAFGIRHVICRTGTPPLQADYPNADGIWDVDSVGLIDVLSGLNAGHDHYGIPLGRATSFVIGARINPSASDPTHEVSEARRKVAAGATFLVTPPVYDLVALEWLLDAIGAPDVPLLLGLMPLHDVAHAEYLQHEVPEMAVPAPVLERMARAGEDGPTVGRDIACELGAAARASGRVRGLVLSSARGSAEDLVELLRLLRAA